jgi:2-phospho-L-lactate guanylyltransferase
VTDAAVLVPVKAFGAAKVRLAPALTSAARAALARSMAERVVAAARPLPVRVACDDEAVRSWAAAIGASVEWTPGLGLNGAVQQGVASLLAEGFDVVVVAHGDLPHASGLERLAHLGDAVVGLVPDRRDDGTNVLALPAAAAGFVFAYGPGSFARHVTEAERLGFAVRVERLPELQWDVDVPDDLPQAIVT